MIDDLAALDPYMDNMNNRNELMKAMNNRNNRTNNRYNKQKKLLWIHTWITGISGMNS
jgi:hypothetical protein